MNLIPKKDEMTPKERMSAFAKGEAIDRIPCIPLMGETQTPLTGKKLSDYYHSPDLMAEVEITCFRMFGHDGVGIGPGLHAIPEAMGTKLKFPDEGLSFVSEPVLKDYADFDRLKPDDPHSDGRLPLILKALQIIDKKIGSQVNIGSGVGGPFTAAAGLRGTENFLRDLQKNPEMAHRLLEIVTESALRYIIDTMMKGTREQILAEAKECLRKTYDNPKGYILSTGCQIPIGTPPENIIALMDAARIYGRMPIDPEILT
ncbi:MAG: uroporphyrinogen decarboxylase family protein [Eubacteriales bacterium]|jgi:uroporphyrinogen decarboxylase